MNRPEKEQSELDAALAKLRLLPDFQLVIQHVHDEREKWILGLDSATTGEMAIKNAGSIVAAGLLYDTLSGA